VKAGAAPRLAAARAVLEVFARGRNLDQALAPYLEGMDDPRDRALTRELAYGVNRRRRRLEALRDALLQRPLKPRDRDLGVLLLVGLYQLLELRIPPHAAVAATVEAARGMGKAWAAGLVNALLRNFQRRRESLPTRPEPARDLPPWLAARLARAWPGRWPELAAECDRHPPMSLRVNRRCGGRDAYLRRLEEAAIEARAVAGAPAALILAQPREATALPGFAEGLVSVQDLSAQYAAPLLAPRPGERVLDACAAPGGKTAHLLELAPGLRLLAVDRDPRRLAALQAHLHRLGLAAECLSADLADPAALAERPPFDRILLDAPCTATGVIRRHPDIKWLRREADVAALTRLQGRILDALWPRLRPGGTLLYATCSLLPEENEEQIAAFLARTRDARESPIAAAWGEARPHGRQLFPERDGGDGFYYALLRREATP